MDLDGAPSLQHRDELLSGVTTIKVPGVARDMSEWERTLYRPRTAGRDRSEGQACELRAIPYFAWANRVSSPMRVWIPSISLEDR